MQVENLPPITCRYCAALDHNVVIMQKQKSGEMPEYICLCAHLCEKDKRMFCPHHNERDATNRYYG